MREPLKKFAEFQESVLKEHDNIKKGVAGWNKESIRTLFNKLVKEVNELEHEIRFSSFSNNIPRECADVANFAMMIYDNVNRDQP